MGCSDSKSVEVVAKNKPIENGESNEFRAGEGRSNSKLSSVKEEATLETNKDNSTETNNQELEGNPKNDERTSASNKYTNLYDEIRPASRKSVRSNRTTDIEVNRNSTNNQNSLSDERTLSRSSNKVDLEQQANNETVDDLRPLSRKSTKSNKISDNQIDRPNSPNMENQELNQ